jgi:Protein of unknown function (DUF559)
VVTAILGAMNSSSSLSSNRLVGIVTTNELLRGGISPARIRTLVRRGDLISMAQGVYVTAELAERLRVFPTGQLAMGAAAALATAGPGSVASHHTAAQIHGLDLLGRASSLVAITRPPGVGSKSGKPGVNVHTAGLPAGHVGWRLGIPVTTVARTVLDLARTSSFREAVVVADSALHQKLTSKKELRAVLAECRGWCGARRAAEVVEFADGLSESVLESIARVVFRDCGLPPPELQVEVSQGDEFIGRVDFMWKRLRTIAEVDGAAKYADSSLAIRQLQRDKKLRRAGYEVEHFDWKEINTQPDHVAASIRAAFRRGSRDREDHGPAA